MFRNKDDYQIICERIGYKFKDKNLLYRAITHKSKFNEDPRYKNLGHQQTLATLGDGVLGAVICDLLMQNDPTLGKDEITVKKIVHIKNTRLKELAGEIGLIEFINMGRGEQKNEEGRKKLLSGTVEAIIGAVFLDSNRDYKVTRAFIAKHFGIPLPVEEINVNSSELIVPKPKNNLKRRRAYKFFDDSSSSSESESDATKLILGALALGAGVVAIKHVLDEEEERERERCCQCSVM